MWLLIVAAIAMLPNALIVYWLIYEFHGLETVWTNHLAVAFIADLILALAVLCWFFAARPPGYVRWPWFLLLSLLGGLGFSIPLYIWLNRRRSDATTQ